MLNQLLLEVAPKKLGEIIETENAPVLPQHKLFFSISPYLAPQENLVDLSAPGSSSSLKTSVKRLPPPIMYTIEPLP